MPTRRKTTGGVLEASVPSLLLGCGLAAMAGVIYSVDAPVWRVMSGIAALCLLALWWMLRRQERVLHEMRQMLGCLREETMTRRSTMRFMFDELLDDSDTLHAQVIRTRYQLQTSLNVALGFLDLLGEELRPLSQAPAEDYLGDLRRAIAQSASLADELGRKSPAGDQNLAEEAGSEKSSTVSARNRL